MESLKTCANGKQRQNFIAIYRKICTLNILVIVKSNSMLYLSSNSVKICICVRVFVLPLNFFLILLKNIIQKMNEKIVSRQMNLKQQWFICQSRKDHCTICIMQCAAHTPKSKGVLQKKICAQCVFFSSFLLLSSYNIWHTGNRWILHAI